MALYRKYRPGSFAELIGQEQVTTPLSKALDTGRINHAYLFSGPRGTGKTSSARILARSLNCVEGPTSTPCGVCPSCIALAPNGPGTLDVTELDAASHNGVEDMRELRDRAAYAPAESRYRIFIIDEAHMITNAGANALLKVVEEPPEHLIFIFATTEPEKVIPTIRSRVHHYPFRLLTPQAMRQVIAHAVEGEGIPVEEAVYPLVIRAGGGSPRDTLSILDQLLAGTGPEGLTYEMARKLLGATDDALIDASIEALGSHDAAAMYTTVDNVIEAGLDPRRFAGDLLDRLRDLMILQSVPEAIEMGLVDAPTDRAEILKEQAAQFDAGQLPQLAATINDGLKDLKGATSPRLLLEILCAKMLNLGTGAALGAAPQISSTAPAQAPSGVAPGSGRAAMQKIREERAKKAQEAQASPAPVAQTVQPQRKQQPQQVPAAAIQRPDNQVPQQEQPTPVATPVREQAASTVIPAASPVQPVTSDDPVALLQDKWAQIRSHVHKENMVAGIMLAEARVVGIENATVILNHNTGALAGRLNAPHNNDSIVKAIKEETGLDLGVRAVVGGETAPVTQAARKSAPVASSSRSAAPKPHPQSPSSPAADDSWSAPAPIGQQGQQARQEQPQEDSWGAPAPLGGSAPSASVEAPSMRAPEPSSVATTPTDAFADGSPLPPEPPESLEMEEPPHVAPSSYDSAPSQPSSAPLEASEAKEEQDMIDEAASESGTVDHRDAMTVAADLLAEQLGARRL